MPRRFNVEFGKEFDGTYWTPIEEAEMYVDRKGNQFRVLRCKCRCGVVKDVLLSNITQKKSKSCGCHRTELHTKHGMCGCRLYHIWENMIQRCTNERNDNYPNYGARGVTICNDWVDFAPFYEWSMSNGYSDGLTLDRVNVDGNYSPENCRWATTKEQANNKRDSRFIEYGGMRMTITEWAEHVNMPANRLRSRLDRGWSFEDAISKPKLN